MHLRTPLGLDDRSSAADGIAPYAGSAVPGPFGTGLDDARRRLAAASEPRPAAVDPAAKVGTSFAVGSDTYRLLRLDTDWREGLDEVRVPPEQAVEVIEQAMRRHQRNREIVHLLETAASQLAGVHEDGVFVLLQRRRSESGAGSVARSAPSSTPSALRPPAPPELELPPPVEEPVMRAAQVVALKNAADSGAPFCEECARAAAQRAAQTA